MNGYDYVLTVKDYKEINLIKFFIERGLRTISKFSLNLVLYFDTTV